MSRLRTTMPHALDSRSLSLFIKGPLSSLLLSPSTRVCSCGRACTV
ncbi:hypothetical protein ISN44_As02g004510, partial [Arabidopsis suecica]